MSERMVNVRRVYAVEYSAPAASYLGWSDEEIVSYEKCVTDAFDMFSGDMQQIEVTVEILATVDL